MLKMTKTAGADLDGEPPGSLHPTGEAYLDASQRACTFLCPPSP
jgi:hypothetical protein